MICSERKNYHDMFRKKKLHGGKKKKKKIEDKELIEVRK